MACATTAAEGFSGNFLPCGRTGRTVFVCICAVVGSGDSAISCRVSPLLRTARTDDAPPSRRTCQIPSGCLPPGNRRAPEGTQFFNFSSLKRQVQQIALLHLPFSCRKTVKCSFNTAQRGEKSFRSAVQGNSGCANGDVRIRPGGSDGSVRTAGQTEASAPAGAFRHSIPFSSTV